MKNQPNNFIPCFKEKDAERFYFSDNEWIKCDEDKIVFLWHKWVVSIKTERYIDGEGFLVFGNKSM